MFTSFITHFRDKVCHSSETFVVICPFFFVIDMNLEVEAENVECQERNYADEIQKAMEEHDVGLVEKVCVYKTSGTGHYLWQGWVGRYYIEFGNIFFVAHHLF